MATLSGVSSSGAITQETLGNSVTSNLARRKILHARTFGGSNLYCTARESGATSGYQVPSGKKFIITTVKYIQLGGTIGDKAALVSSTTDAGYASTSGPATYDFSSPGFGSFGNLNIAVAATETVAKTFIYVIPEGRFVTVYSPANNATYTVIGYEVDASDRTL